MNYSATGSCQTKKEKNEIESQKSANSRFTVQKTTISISSLIYWLRLARIKGRRGNIILLEFTFKIQIFGTIDDLSDHLSIHLQAVCITVISGDDNIVPLVVIERTVTVAFDNIRSISKVKYIMYVPVSISKKQLKFCSNSSTTDECQR